MKYTLLFACLLSVSCATVYGMENNNALNIQGNRDIELNEHTVLMQSDNRVIQQTRAQGRNCARYTCACVGLGVVVVCALGVAVLVNPMMLESFTNQ